MKVFAHQDLAQGRWFTFTLAQQLANIGSEVGRALRWQDKDEQNFRMSVERALELFDLTLEDERWKGRRIEIARARELFCRAIYNNQEYRTSLSDLDRYFLVFAVLAQQQR